MLRLVVFLGNPGSLYARSRHNAGRLLAARLPFYDSLVFRDKFQGLYAENNGSKFLMPETFMNDSGVSIAEAASFYRIEPEEILVCHDELELPLGTVSLKWSGGLGGHNGLRSAKACLGTADFWRFRIGIGRPDDRIPGKGGNPEHHGDIAGWVLSPFTQAEETTLNPTLASAAEALVKLLENEPETLLPEWGKKKITVKPNVV
jgi:PTH1 family peptidyl-tRNA hydrolase